MEVSKTASAWGAPAQQQQQEMASGSENAAWEIWLDHPVGQGCRCPQGCGLGPDEPFYPKLPAEGRSPQQDPANHYEE